MNKVGIITMAYRSQNYGGILQAYALARCLKNFGCPCEIIRYDYSSGEKERTALERWRQASLSERISKVLRNLKNLPANCAVKIGNRLNRGHFSERSRAFAEFHQHSMPYSEGVFSYKTIENCVPDYDLFITGSDQVWNQGWINEIFLLDFVPPGKEKISYAASIAQNEIPAAQGEKLRASLKSFQAVSVREEQAAEQLAALNIGSELVLDPTLLLSCDEWEELCSPRVVGGSYLFCYFLGNNPVMRGLAAEFAKKHRLKIVTLPHLLGDFRLCDIGFGDQKLYAVSPADFLSLVRHADYIFTDSFHGCIFSFLYKKQFFAFDRVDRCSFGMTARIRTMMKIFDTTDRLCDTGKKAGIRYIESVPDIDYSIVPEGFRKMQGNSRRFLQDNIRRRGGKEAPR